MNRTGKPRRTKSSTIAGVASVEPESTTTISAQSRRLSRQLPMQGASLKQITAALRPSAPGAGGSEGRTGDRLAGSVKAIQPLLWRRAASFLGVRSPTRNRAKDSADIWAICPSLARSVGGSPASEGLKRSWLARPGARHHIAAMIEPSPSPSPVWTLDSDSLDQGPGAPSTPSDAALLDD